MSQPLNPTSKDVIDFLDIPALTPEKHWEYSTFLRNIQKSIFLRNQPFLRNCSQDPGNGSQDPGNGSQDPGARSSDQDPGARSSDQDPVAGRQDPVAGRQDPVAGSRRGVYTTRVPRMDAQYGLYPSRYPR